MTIAHSFAEIHIQRPVLLTIGTFDGVHRGHRYLLEEARNRAVECGFELAIVSFDPCPAVVLRPAFGRYQLTSASQKVRLLKDLQPSMIALLHFTRELSLLTASEFMDALEARLQVRELWFGEDFRFGHDRGGDPPMLVERGRKSGFALHMVSRRMEEKESISSSRIRRTISAGRVASAIPLLGYPFERECFDMMFGPWLGGHGKWAQVAVPPHMALPADGVYAVICSTGQHTVAAVTAHDDMYQLRVKDCPGVCSVTVSFIDRVSSLDQYRLDPRGYDERAHALLAEWRRPVYVPSRHH